MIISASRRTDIPAFYSEWLMNRVRAGYCTVPNPFNTHQISRISLKPDEVTVIVFWTRNPRPLMPYLEALDRTGYHYYFQYTIMSNPRQIDRKSPPMDAAIRTFQELSAHVGSRRVVWRYDPIVLSNQTDVDFHLRTYQTIATQLVGYTQRSVISIVDEYSKAKKRLKTLAENDIHVHFPNDSDPMLADLMGGIKGIADQHHYELFSCAEQLNLTHFGIQPGKCVDDTLIQEAFGIDVTQSKDKTQREACNCVTSRDIGVYDTCLFGCQYCYATRSFELATSNYQQHDPLSPSLIGHHDVPDTNDNSGTNPPSQLELF